MPRQTTVNIKPPIDGGDLMNNMTLEGIGALNYVVKKDWRREYDTESRREGDVLFTPTSCQDAMPDKLGGKTVEHIHFAQAPNGQVILLAFTKCTVYRWFGELNDLNYCDDVFEDDVYCEDSNHWRSINPEGVSFCETPIGEDCCDNPTILLKPHRWEAETVNGITIFNNGVDLPHTYCPWEYRAQPAYEIRERCIARVGTIMKINGMILLMDITDIHEDDFKNWMNGTDPYGVYTKNTAGRRQYRLINGKIGDPRLWGTAVKGTIKKGSRTIKLETPMRSVKCGDDISVEGADDGQSNLTVRVISVTDTEITVAEPAKSDAYVKTIVKCANLKAAPSVTHYDLQEDGSAIIRGMALGTDKMIIYKDTGHWLGAYTGNVSDPFQFQHAYSGRKTLHYRWSLMPFHTDGGVSHIYAGKNAFYMSNGGEPAEPPKLMMCKELFFDNVTDRESAFAADNKVSEEYWLRFDSDDPTINLLCYSYRWDSVSYSNRGYVALANARKEIESIEGVSSDCFLVSDDKGRVLIYAATDEKERLLNGKRDFFGLGGRMNRDVCFSREEVGDCILSAASGDFFCDDDEGKYFFIEVGKDYVVSKITKYYSPTHVELEDDILTEESCFGGVFEDYCESILEDGYEAFSSRQQAEEDEIEMYGLTVVMGSKDCGADYLVELFGAKNPSDNTLSTQQLLMSREITDPRKNFIPLWYRKNYYKTRISVKNSLLNARFASKIYRVKRLTGSDRLTSGNRLGELS